MPGLEPATLFSQPSSRRPPKRRRAAAGHGRVEARRELPAGFHGGSCGFLSCFAGGHRRRSGAASLTTGSFSPPSDQQLFQPCVLLMAVRMRLPQWRCQISACARASCFRLLLRAQQPIHVRSSFWELCKMLEPQVGTSYESILESLQEAAPVVTSPWPRTANAGGEASHARAAGQLSQSPRRDPVRYNDAIASDAGIYVKLPEELKKVV